MSAGVDNQPQWRETSQKGFSIFVIGWAVSLLVLYWLFLDLPGQRFMSHDLGPLLLLTLIGEAAQFGICFVAWSWLKLHSPLGSVTAGLVAGLVSSVFSILVIEQLGGGLASLNLLGLLGTPTGRAFGSAFVAGGLVFGLGLGLFGSRRPAHKW